jgi:hypothetical protein
MKELEWTHKPIAVHFVDPTSPHITACRKVIRGKDWPRTEQAEGITCALCWNRIRARFKPGFTRPKPKPLFER